MGSVTDGAFPVREVVFGVSNIGIFLGYVFVGLIVVPHFPVRLAQTKIGGFFFFMSCGLTHLELAIHAFLRGGLDYPSMLSWHMLTIHAVQVLSVWVFVWGLYQEFVKPHLPHRGQEVRP